MAGTVHIAGLQVRVDELLRQRCAWCEHVLLDYDLQRLAVPEGQDPTPATWPVGALVLVDGGLSTLLRPDDDGSAGMDLESSQALPPQACARREEPR